MNEMLFVNFQNTGDDNALLIIGKGTPDKQIELINAFEGETAISVYNMLISPNKGE